MISSDLPSLGRVPGAVTLAQRWLTRLLVLAIGASCVIVIHESLDFITRAPLLSVDDSIPNVAVSLAEHGRYGFLASPTQGYFEVDRTRGFFNYGPLYFYVAALLTWVANPSLAMYRMLHPLGLIVAVLLFAWTFRRVSLVGVAILAVCLFDIYYDAQWPLARPDIMVSVCAALMLACVARAIERGDPWSWCAAGFFAASAVTTHQIAGAVIVATGIAWFWATLVLRAVEPDRFARQTMRMLAALVAGGLVAAAMYLVAIRFRVSDLLTLGAAGLAAYSRPFWQTVSTHFSYAWSSSSPAIFWFLAAGVAGAGVLSAAAPFFPTGMRRQILSRVMPAFVLATAYQMSLGLYGNNHTGYVILSQVATLWAVGAVVSIVVAWIHQQFAEAGRVAAVMATLAALLFVARADARWLRTTSLWEAVAASNVDIDDYVAQSVAPLPERAATWGSLYFGLTAGDRTDIVQFLQMFDVVSRDFAPPQRARLAPDFLLLSNYETDLDISRYLSGHESYLEQFFEVIGELHYRGIRLVYAPPYGVVRTYEQRAAAGASTDGVPPAVAVNDGTSRQWSTQLGEPVDARFTESAPMTANIEFYGMSSERRAVTTVSAPLPPGFYVLHVVLERAAPGRVGFLVTSPGPHVFWRGGWTQFAVPATPYLPGETRVHLLVDHLGGPLHIGRFENGIDRRIRVAEVWKTMMAGPVGKGTNWSDPSPSPAYGFHVTAVHPVNVLADNTGRAAPRSLPSWSTWMPSNPPAAETAGVGGGRLRISGTPAVGAYLLTSPRMKLAPDQRIVINIPTETKQGAVEVGLFGTDGQWVLPPVQMPRRIAYQAADAIEVSIVITNSQLKASKLDVVLGSATFQVASPSEFYVDRLMRCRPALGAKPSDCLK